jgi:hypothetical protein
VLFALGQPATLLGLLLAYVLGMFAQTWAQRLVVGGRSGLRGISRPQLWLDPFSAVAALLGGMGWAPRQELNRRRSSAAFLVVVVSVVIEAALAIAGGVAYKAAGGTAKSLTFISTVDVVHGHQIIVTSVAQRVALGFLVESLACGMLCLLPIPPLPLGVWLWSALPRTEGARRLAYHLLEEQWGVAILLVLLLIPLGGQQPALLALLSEIANPVLHSL